jgi:hypothetical protein
MLNLQNLARRAYLGHEINPALEKLAKKTGRSFQELHTMIVSEIEIFAHRLQQQQAVATRPYHRS